MMPVMDDPLVERFAPIVRELFVDIVPVIAQFPFMVGSTGGLPDPEPLGPPQLHNIDTKINTAVATEILTAVDLTFMSSLLFPQVRPLT
jgi:hypothetical protein